MKPEWKQGVKFALLLLAILIYLARAWWMDDGRYVLYDDAFISFRYARNLAHGHGLVFNPGQRVEGYTNFLWVILLAGGIRLGSDPIWLAKVAGLVCGLAVIILTMLLADRLAPGAGIWTACAPLMLVSTASLSRYALSGMETLMFSMWLCLALWLELGAGEQGGILAAMSWVLAALTRPEGMLFCGTFVVARTVERILRGEKRVAALWSGLSRLLTFGVLFAPYFLWRYAYYGYLAPNTFYAKVGGLQHFAIRRGLDYLYNVLLILNLPLVICGGFTLLVLSRRGVPAMLFTLVAYVAYVVVIGGDDFTVFGPRFLLVILPWLAALGLAGLIELTICRFQVPWPLFTIFVVALMALSGGLSVFETMAYRGVVGTMNRGWWVAAEWLKAHARPGDWIAVDAAGIIPYHTDLPAIDMLGLNDVHIAHLSVTSLGSGYAGHEKFDPDYVLAQRPVYITTWLDVQGQPCSAGLGDVADRLKEQYELVAVVLMRLPVSNEPVLLDLGATAYTEAHHEYGYIYGVFRLRTRP